MAVGFVNGGLRIDEEAHGTLLVGTHTLSVASTCVHTLTAGGAITLEIDIDTKVALCYVLITDDGSGRVITYGTSISAPTASKTLTASKVYKMELMRSGSIWYTEGLIQVSV